MPAKNPIAGVWQKITAPFATKPQLQGELATPTAFTGTARPVAWPFSAASLTPAKLVSMLDAARNGFPEEALALFEYVEEADPELRFLLDTRKRALTGKRLVVEAVGDDALSQEVADVCRQALALDFVPDMLFHALDAIWKSFSVQEMVVDTRGKYWLPSAVLYRPQHFFQVSRDDGSTILLKNPSDPLSGSPLEVGKYVVHRPALKSGFVLRNGLGMVGSWLYLLGTINLKNWLSNTESYGKPFRLGRFAPGTPKEEVLGFKAALALLGTDAYAVLPKNMEVELLNAATAGNAEFFERLSRYMGELKAKLVLGQTKSSDGQGGSLALAKAHLSVMEDIVIADAQSLIATLRRDYLGAIVRWNFGPDVPVPAVRFQIEDPVDAVAFTTAVEKLVGMGCEIEASVVRDRLGLPDPKPGSKLLHPSTTGTAAADTSAPVANARHSRDTLAAHTPDSLDGLTSGALAAWQQAAPGLKARLSAAVASASNADELKAALIQEVLSGEHPEVVEVFANLRAISKTVGLAAGDIGDGVA